MGNQSRQRLGVDSQLDYYSIVLHPLHGTCRIFTSKSLPMTFLLRLERSTVHSRLFHLFQQIQDVQSPHLICLYGFKIERGMNCTPCSECPPADRTVEYWEYLNYSLGHHVRDRNRRNAPFTQHEIWHIIQSVCDVAKLLAQYGLIWEISPFQLYITPEGKLKCEWSHLEINNVHLRYYKKLHTNYEKDAAEEDWANSETEMEWEEFTSPEEQWLIKEREQSSRLNLEKSNSYKFGMLLLYVLTLQTHAVPVQWQLLNKVIPQLAAKYPPIILEVLQGTLNPNPFLRWSLEKVRESCINYFNLEYELLINQGRREEIQQFNMEAQFRAGSSKQTHRGLNPSQQLSVLHDSGRLQESRDKRTFHQIGIRSSQDKQYRNASIAENNLDRRTLELREYRKRLKESKN